MKKFLRLRTLLLVLALSTLAISCNSNQLSVIGTGGMQIEIDIF